MEMNIFEKASRIKLRINSTKGILSVEDLWDLPLEKLNNLAKDINRKLREQGEEDFLGNTPSRDSKLSLTLDIIKEVITVRLGEKLKQEEAAEKKTKKERLMAILARKEEESLEGKSAEEIRKLIAELD